MRTLAVIGPASPSAWSSALRDALPELDVRVWPDVGAPEGVSYALCWKPPAGIIDSLPSLRAVFSLGAGIDHLGASRGEAGRVPVIRMVEPALTEGMSEYVVYNVLRFHRRMPEYERMRARRQWRALPQTRPYDRRVGIMGLGVLGRDAALKLVGLGFRVAGWSRTPKVIEGVDCHHGSEGLAPFLAETEILVCLLPLTGQTEGILGRRLFDLLPRGACLVNAARGGHLVENDLLDSLESGQIAEAALDVCGEEPPPHEHPFWSHPRITLTPHVASLTNPVTAAAEIARSIRRIERGEFPPHVVDWERGY